MLPFPWPNISLTYVHIELIFLGETPTKLYSPQIQHYNRSKKLFHPHLAWIRTEFICLQEHGKFACSYTHTESFSFRQSLLLTYLKGVTEPYTSRESPGSPLDFLLSPMSTILPPPLGNASRSVSCCPMWVITAALISREQWACCASRMVFHNSPVPPLSNDLSVSWY